MNSARFTIGCVKKLQKQWRCKYDISHFHPKIYIPYLQLCRRSSTGRAIKNINVSCIRHKQQIFEEYLWVVGSNPIVGLISKPDITLVPLLLHVCVCVKNYTLYRKMCKVMSDRSLHTCGCVGIGRRNGLKIRRYLLPCEFKSHHPHSNNSKASVCKDGISWNDIYLFTVEDWHTRIILLLKLFHAYCAWKHRRLDDRLFGFGYCVWYLRYGAYENETG